MNDSHCFQSEMEIVQRFTDAVLVSIMTHSLESEQLATDQIDACYSLLIHVAILYGTCCLLTCWRISLLASQIWTFERHYAKVKHLVI